MKHTCTLKNTGRMLLLSLIVALVGGLTSCTQQPTDVTSLLSTVPSSSGLVVGLNLKSILDKTGGKVEGNNTEMLRVLLNGDSGIDPVGLVVFQDAYNIYATAMLADTDKFISFVEDQTGSQFAEAEGGVRICGQVAINGAQMWYCYSSLNGIDARAIKNYASLSENQSFLSKDVSAPIAEMKTDIAGWADINTLSKKIFSFKELATLNIAVGALFEDPASVAFTINSEKNTVDGKVSVLNNKGKNAKFLLPTKKIDTDLVKGLGGTANFVGGVSLTGDLTKKVEKMLNSFGGGLFDEYVKLLAPLDGTVAVAAGTANGEDTPLNGVAQVKGEQVADLMNFLSRYGATKKEEKLISFSKGTVEGDVKVEEAAAFLKGAWLGGVYHIEDSKEGYRTLAVALAPEDGGLRTEVKVTGTDPAKNLLIPIIADMTEMIGK